MVKFHIIQHFIWVFTVCQSAQYTKGYYIDIQGCRD